MSQPPVSKFEAVEALSQLLGQDLEKALQRTMQKTIREVVNTRLSTFEKEVRNAQANRNSKPN